MTSHVKIGALITTSQGRADLLFGRSLPSVLRQTSAPDAILVADDNDDEIAKAHIKSTIAAEHPTVWYSENKRTRHRSGTGSWNTGIDILSEQLGDDAYVAILDDDDNGLRATLSIAAKPLRRPTRRPMPFSPSSAGPIAQSARPSALRA